MNSKALPRQVNPIEVGVYECDIHLKFRFIEEKSLLGDRDQLLQVLLEALADGSDEFVDMLHQAIKVREASELTATPEMRRQLMRLRNSIENSQ
ncbi:MAG: Npun_R1517 family heterocyst differentiation transcriptional regulator [Calothrix sp. MO_192.B10]|nr:Npun_R1517 family heterocyst differentiation transcriptional regulator [Calothrix sp. MO_192.B10]